MTEADELLFKAQMGNKETGFVLIWHGARQIVKFIGKLNRTIKGRARTCPNRGVVDESPTPSIRSFFVQHASPHRHKGINGNHEQWAPLTGTACARNEIRNDISKAKPPGRAGGHVPFGVRDLLGVGKTVEKLVINAPGGPVRERRQIKKDHGQTSATRARML